MSKVGSVGPVTYYRDSTGAVWADVNNKLERVHPDEAEQLAAAGLIE